VRRAYASQTDEAAAIRIGDIGTGSGKATGEDSEDADPPDTQGVRVAAFSDVARRPSSYPRPHTGGGVGPEYGGELEYLRTFVRQLRKKLGDDASAPKYVFTDLQVGYRFGAEDDLVPEGERDQEILPRNIFMLPS